MTIRMRVDDRAYQRLLRNTAKLPRLERETVELAAGNAMAQEIARVARSTAPRATGRLQRTVRAARRRVRGAYRKVRTLAVVLAGSRRVNYTAAVHYGHRDRGGGQVPAQPFLADAVRRSRGRLLTIARIAASREFNKLRTRLGSTR